MKVRSIKRLLSAVFAASMLMGSVLTVSASSAGMTPGEGPTAESGGVTIASVESVTSVGSGSSVLVAGTKVENTVAGSYSVKTFQGAAVITPVAQVRTNLGLKNGQTPHILAFDTDVKKSKLAMDCVYAAAGALNANVISAVNVTLDARENGKLITLANGSAAMMLGLPKNADPSKTYYVVCVQPKGVVTVLNDLDNIPTTVTFDIQAGLGTYAVIAQ